LLKGLLTDDNDSVKIHAVTSSVTVAKLINDSELVRSEVIPALKTAVDNKLSWRLRFSVAETAAALAEYLSK
jgi:hypothetical protein